jgi:hypothetical protein
MRFRKWRVAWSVAWAIVTLVAVALWVRSYWKNAATHAYVGPSQYVRIASGVGQLGLYVSQPRTYSIHDINSQPGAYPLNRYRWLLLHANGAWVVIFPWSFVVYVFIGLSAIVWLPVRFGLRMMLLATTLVAAVLGMEIYAATR